MAVDQTQFKQALAAWASGVTIVTTKTAEGEVSGMTASAFSSVSAEPPLVLVCINKSASSCPLISASGNFAVNVLKTGQDGISNKFASYKDKDTRWQDLAVSTGVTGAPLLDESLASLDCKVVQSVEAGTHIVFIGEVQDAVVREGDPLLYFKGAYRGVTGL